MTNIDFLKLSIEDILRAYRCKQLSPVDVARHCIQKVEALEPKYQAWVDFDPENLLAQARSCERRLLSHAPRSIEGIPIGVKDIFNTFDFPTQMGSPLWDGFKPGNDARTVFYIREAGGVIPGKTVTAEFAVHALGKTLNPHNILRNPGTSSSGSAVAVALGMVPVSLGTQTAGSIVRPASFCGIYGCKPSFGIIPRTGMLKTTDSLDSVGFFCSLAKDLPRIFDILRVHGVDYPVSHAAFTDTVRQSKPPKASWQIAFVKTHTWSLAEKYAQDSCQAWVKKLGKIRGFNVEEVNLPSRMQHAHEVHSAIYNKTLAYYFSGEYKNHALISSIMNELIRDGQNISVAQYEAAIIEQEKLQQSMDKMMSKYDALVSLSTAGAAPLRTEQETPDPCLMWTLAGLPVVGVPALISPDGLPMGIQFAARRYNDFRLFQLIADMAEQGIVPSGTHPAWPGYKGFNN